MNKSLRIVLFGFLSWLVPFVASIFFFSPEGGLVSDVFLFKTIMIVVGSATAAVLFVLHFRNVKQEFLKEGIVIGVAWFALNIVLDILVLLPLTGTDIPTYFAQIGARYLVLPIMAATIGFVAEKKA